mmetsp:Transcript_8651/g.21949  ORF Transcript_8651/g.21949 Transcript_8651/m.21949 type:complete len:235 (+) Transcript_8651:379-1083(+)
MPSASIHRVRAQGRAGVSQPHRQELASVRAGHSQLLCLSHGEEALVLRGPQQAAHYCAWPGPHGENRPANGNDPRDSPQTNYRGLEASPERLLPKVPSLATRRRGSKRLGGIEQRRRGTRRSSTASPARAAYRCTTPPKRCRAGAVSSSSCAPRPTRGFSSRSLLTPDIDLKLPMLRSGRRSGVTALATRFNSGLMGRPPASPSSCFHDRVGSCGDAGRRLNRTQCVADSCSYA